MKIRILCLAVFICLLGTMSLQGQQNQVRKPAVAGSFYPADAESLKKQLDQFFHDVDDKTVDENIAAIIVPHAGYVFSGPVAASAYTKIDPESSFDRVFIIGTSHHVMLNGASVYNQGDYSTPLGTVKVDLALANQLINESRLIKYVREAHSSEHSIEVQLPFLQYRLKNPFKIVPIVIGTQTAETCSRLAHILEPWFTPENLFVISSDFSHYPKYADAVKNDQSTGIAVLSNSPGKFINTLVANERKEIQGLATSCCGWSSVLTLLDITSAKPDIQVKHLKYMNSGDTPYGDKYRVVGYHSFIFTREQGMESQQGFHLTREDMKMLLAIARESIQSDLEGKAPPEIRESELSENLKKSCGAFVTLNKDGKLRGCIGRFIPTDPLYKVVQDMARAAAFQDYRFSPVGKAEMKHIDIEISVLTPLRRIYSLDEFELGKQGIYIIKGNRSGTFLPQVAESTHWNKEEFLGHCAQDKAGIGWDGWKDADLYTYEAVVFDEKELLSGVR